MNFMADDPLERYGPQVRYAQLGDEGQRRLLASHVLICGCGALGSVLANTLARAGVGRLRIVDRDFVETANLQRQVLFDELDAQQSLPKAVAAAEKLRRINSQIAVEPIVADMDAGNLLALCDGVDLIVDGTDNFEARFLLNDAALKLGVPWIYGGCLGSQGQTMTIIPGRTPCLRCVLGEPPPPGSMPTCDTAGILAPIIGVIASIQAMEALKILSGNAAAIQPYLSIVELWDNTFRQVRLDQLREAGDCPACQRREFDWLSGTRASQAAVLCGRNAVQFRPPGMERVSLDELAIKLAEVGSVTRNAFLLRLAVGDYLLTIFPDGRAIIGGTSDPAIARSVYARYIGN
ncbi:MAG TPA: ThiF family adenylyltransferase [Pirellulales bacterium]|nr:ThiF family adenylyltransferase [Pirellulales bacterium]